MDEVAGPWAASDAGVNPPEDGAGGSGVFACGPGAGDCCSVNGSAGCDDIACCEAVCAFKENPWCCENDWDSACSNVAETVCPTVCSANPDCPSEGDCCVNHGGTGCNNAFCCDLVCTQDESCCTAVWGNACADLAVILCPEIWQGGPSCPGAGDCCGANGTAGCDNGCCCEVVCADNAVCCDTEWSEACATAAADLCPGLCAAPLAECPGDGGDCLIRHSEGQAGCDDEFCCSLVCTVDPKCCFGTWDTICVGLAADLCDCPAPVCPGEGGACCQANGTTGCDDPTCCGLVCDEDPQCCGDVGWDEACVGIAEDLCGDLCVCASFGDFDNSGAVNLADFARFQSCFTGEGGTIGDGCACADNDGDGAASLSDYAAFRTLLDPP